MLNRFKDHLKSANLFSSDHSLLIAVSGGVDSMVLAHLMSKIGLVFSVVHVNHHTRNGASDKDQSFVNNHFSEKGIKVYNFDFKHDGKGNFHNEAHKARYSFFRSLGYDKIFTAHHLDDHIETIMVNILNGRSTAGINGNTNDIIRPLLPFTKEDILTYAEAQSIPFIEDITNSENLYLRNFLRNTILPLIAERNDITGKLINLSQRQEEDNELLKELLANTITVREENKLDYIPISQLLDKSPAFLFHGLYKYGLNRTQCSDLSQILEKVGKEIYTETHHLVVDRSEVVIKQLSHLSIEEIEVRLSDFPFSIEYGRYKLTFSKVSQLPSRLTNNIAYFPISKLGTSLILRPWQEGDLLYPYGMDGRKKKLKKIFIDKKVDRITKNLLPVVLNYKDIIWIPSLISDNRYQVPSDEKEILRIEFTT